MIVVALLVCLGLGYRWVTVDGGFGSAVSFGFEGGFGFVVVAVVSALMLGLGLMVGLILQ